MSYNNIDMMTLRQAVNDFVFNSRPSNASGSAPCTNKDLNNVINGIAKLFNTFIDELEN